MKTQTSDFGMTIWFLAEANDRLAKAKNETDARLARISIDLMHKTLRGEAGTLRETTAFMALFFGGEFDQAIDYDG